MLSFNVTCWYVTQLMCTRSYLSNRCFFFSNLAYSKIRDRSHILTLSDETKNGRLESNRRVKHFRVKLSLSLWLICSGGKFQSSLTECLWLFILWSGLRQPPDVPPSWALERNRWRVWAVIAEATLNGGLSEAHWQQELDGIWRPGPPLIIFKSASCWMPPPSPPLLARAYLNMDRWGHSVDCLFCSCNHVFIIQQWWCQTSWLLEAVMTIFDKNFIKLNQQLNHFICVNTTIIFFMDIVLNLESNYQNERLEMRCEFWSKTLNKSWLSVFVFSSKQFWIQYFLNFSCSSITLKWQVIFDRSISNVQLFKELLIPPRAEGDLCMFREIRISLCSQAVWISNGSSSPMACLCLHLSNIWHSAEIWKWCLPFLSWGKNWFE